MHSSGEVAIDDVVLVLNAHRVDISSEAIDSKEITTLVKGDVVVALHLPAWVGRRILHLLKRKLNIPICMLQPLSAASAEPAVHLHGPGRTQPVRNRSYDTPHSVSQIADRTATPRRGIGCRGMRPYRALSRGRRVAAPWERASSGRTEGKPRKRDRS